jgi:hypothetical protein
MFLRIGRRYMPFLAFHQFFPTLPIIWTQVAGKGFLQNPRWFSFKAKKRTPSAPTLEQDLSFRWTVHLKRPAAARGSVARLCSAQEPTKKDYDADHSLLLF